MQSVAVTGINAGVALLVIHALFGRLAAGSCKALNLVFQVRYSG